MMDYRALAYSSMFLRPDAPPTADQLPTSPVLPVPPPVGFFLPNLAAHFAASAHLPPHLTMPSLFLPSPTAAAVVPRLSLNTDVKPPSVDDMTSSPASAPPPRSAPVSSSSAASSASVLDLSLPKSATKRRRSIPANLEIVKQEHGGHSYPSRVDRAARTAIATSSGSSRRHFDYSKIRIMTSDCNAAPSSAAAAAAAMSMCSLKQELDVISQQQHQQQPSCANSPPLTPTTPSSSSQVASFKKNMLKRYSKSVASRLVSFDRCACACVRAGLRKCDVNDRADSNEFVYSAAFSVFLFCCHSIVVPIFFLVPAFRFCARRTNKELITEVGEHLKSY